jgi:MFS family permease
MDASHKRVLLASAVGSALEWYDFFIYGTAAALVFGELFFPKADPSVGTLLAFATFGVGFVARPFGGLVFGHLGDRIGRKPVLVITLMLVGAGTFLIGLLPTYNSAGVWAPILLVVLRLVQGFGAGAEYGGAVIMAVEHAPPGKRGLFGSVAPGRNDRPAAGQRRLRPLLRLAERRVSGMGLAHAIPVQHRAHPGGFLHPRESERDSGIQ